MLEVYTWEPSANSGKPLLCRKEKHEPCSFYYIGMGLGEHFSPAFVQINRDGVIPGWRVTVSS